MEAFYGLAPLKQMEVLLADDLEFDGPFYKSDTAKEYLSTLRENPPVDVHFDLEESFENSTSVCFIYRYSKPGVETRMAQTFKITNGKISRIRLVFDTNAFA